MNQSKLSPEEFIHEWRKLTPDDKLKVWRFMEALRIAAEMDMNARTGGRKLEDMDWSVRVRNAFRAEGIETLVQLISQSALDLRRTPNLGAKSVREVQEKLAEVGLSLRAANGTGGIGDSSILEG